MKNVKKIISMVLLFLGAILTLVTSASAAKLGDPYTWVGIQIGWVLIIIAIVFAFLCWALIDKVATAKKIAVPICAILVVAGFIFALTDVAAEVEELEITPDVAWSVTATEQQGGNITIDNDLNKIIVMCHVNSTEGNITDDDNTDFTVPIINFTIAPTMTEGLTPLDVGATTIASVVNPDAAFTVSGTSYDLFSDVSGTTGDKDLEWTADGTIEYEWHYCTVQFGASEVAELEVNYNPAGISQLAAGTIKSSTITIGGTTYTISLIITGVLT